MASVAVLSRDSPGLLDDGADAFKGDRLSGAPRHQGSLLVGRAPLRADPAPRQPAAAAVSPVAQHVRG